MKSFVAVVAGLAAGAAGASAVARKGVRVEKLAEAVSGEVMRAFARLVEDFEDIVAEARAQGAAERKEQRATQGRRLGPLRSK